MSFIDRMTADVDGRLVCAMQSTLSGLFLIGVLHATREWGDAIAVWSFGREPSWWARAPWAMVAALVACAVALLVGWRTRVVAVASSALLLALMTAVPSTYHNNYYLLSLMLLLLALAPHPAYRLGWFLGDAPARQTGLFPRMVQAQLAVVYLGSVLVKLSHPWWQGTGTVIRWAATVRVPPTHTLLNVAIGPLLAHPTVAAVADVVVTGVETALPLALLTPRWRRVGVCVGVVMHVFMHEWLFPQLFTMLMLWGYLSFSPAGARDLAVAPFAGERANRWLRAVDWYGRFEVTDRPDARRGLARVRALVLFTPLGLMSYALFALAFPSVTHVGPLARTALENAVVLAVGVLMVPEMWARGSRA